MKPTRRTQNDSKWPKVYTRTYPSGQVAYIVDLGFVNGKRERHTEETLEDARVYAEQARIKRNNEGLASFTLSSNIQRDAQQASEKLQPHGISLATAADYYLKHVIAFKDAPNIGAIAKKLIANAESNNRRDRTVGDLTHRLTSFATDFGEMKLADLTLEQIKEWVADDDWAPRTRINFLTKISQLYNFAIKHGWCEHNIAERIDRPDVDDDEPGIFTVDQAKALLEHAGEFGLLPYISIALFAGLRSAELMRLDGGAIKFDERAIIVGADVAKKRSRRVVEICDALVSWLKPLIPMKGPIVDTSTFRDNMDLFRTAAEIQEWPHNGLRHSFGSYHLAMHGDQVKTAAQMGHRDATVIHNHYKALVMKVEAEKYWGLNRSAGAKA